jgi:uncharacterized protein (DUF433 family)
MKFEHPEFHRISINSDICFGKPHITGTRMPVSSVLSYLSSGMALEDLLKEFSQLTREDVLEALAFSKA